MNWSVRLAPVPFHQNIAAALVDIMMRYPAGVRPWRLFPPAWGPGVGVSIVTMVPGDPYMVTAGPRPPCLVYRYGWPEANHKVAPKSAESQRACENQSDQSFHKHNTLFSLLVSDYE